MSLSLCCISQRGNDETIDNNTTRCYRLRSGLFPVLPCLLNKHSASPVCCKVLKNLLQVQPTPPRSLILAVWVGTLGLSATLRSFKGLSRTRHGLNCDDDSNSRRRTNNTKASHLAGGRSSSLNVEVTAGGPTSERLLPDADCKRQWRKIAGMLFTATAVNLLQTFLRTSLFPKSFITLGLN